MFIDMKGSDRVTRTAERTGSSMSNKQVAYAASAGHKITFQLGHGHPEVCGYVVGMDDFHWMVAVPNSTDEISKVIVSKGNTVALILSPEPTLTNEPPAIRVAVTEVGRGFWLFCDKTYFGKNEPATRSTPS